MHIMRVRSGNSAVSQSMYPVVLSVLLMLATGMKYRTIRSQQAWDYEDGLLKGVNLLLHCQHNCSSLC